jgi:protein SCO1
MNNQVSFSCIAILLTLMACRSKQVQLPVYNAPDFTPHWMESENDIATHTIGEFSLTNQDHKIITNKDVKGKIYIANFFFTTCNSICPKMMHNLKKVADAYAKDKNVRILSHTVMPEADSVPRLQQYAQRMGASSEQWWLLTGNKDSIYRLAREDYFADNSVPSPDNDFLHTENCVLVDTKGRIRGVYNATVELEIVKLIEHIRLLEQE